MSKTNFERLEIFHSSEELADYIWELVHSWDYLAKETVGKQIIRAADSVGANIAEGAGSTSSKDYQRFVKIARASLNETKYWLRRAEKRALITAEQSKFLFTLLDNLMPRVNAFINALSKCRTTPDKRN